jgi:hypothetical protein
MKLLVVTAILGGTLLAQEPAAPAPQQAPGNPGQSNVAATLHVYAYPNKGQNQNQQFKDESECYNSAQTQAAPSQNAQAGQQQDQSDKAGKGATVKGTAGGAAGGAAIGAIAGDAGTGAAIGAVGGAAVGHRKKKKAKEKAKEEQQQQQQAAQNQATDNLKRAYTACMEARNYTVK